MEPGVVVGPADGVCDLLLLVVGETGEEDGDEKTLEEGLALDSLRLRKLRPGSA